MPAPFGLLLARVNPIAFSISLTRNGLLYGVNSFHWSYFIWLALGLILSLVGTRLIYKNENTYVKVI